MFPYKIIFAFALVGLLDVQIEATGLGHKNGNKLDYADAHCLQKLTKAMENAVSKIVAATSDIKNQQEKHELAEEMGKMASRAAQNSVTRNLSVQDDIVRAVNGANPNPALNLGETVRPVIKARLQKMCVNSNCCYN